MKLTLAQKEKRDKKKARLALRAIKPKKVKHSISSLKFVCDGVFSYYIRFIRDKDKPCMTCGRIYDDYDNGHYQVRTHMNTRYSEMNCAKQCFRCNGPQGGEQVIFGRRIDETYGQGMAESLEIFARQISRIKQEELLEIYNRYYKLLKENNVTFPKIYDVKKYLYK